MLDLIGSNCGSSENNEKAILLDICCGTGIIGICLSKYFERVIGLEVIQSSIDNAISNIEYNSNLD